MSGLRDNPRYVSLARRAAGRMGTSAEPIVRAILAQWQCEIGNMGYPPTRNNPGNLAAGAARSIGASYTVPDAGHNPQPGNPIVTFPSPEAGADAYGKLLATLGRYGGVRAAVQARNGAAFLQAIHSSGYGGNLSCELGVYGSAGVTGTFGGGGIPAPPGPVGIPIVAPGTADYSAKFLALLGRLGISTDPTHVISHSEAIAIVGGFGSAFGGGAHPMAATFEGQTVGKLAAQLQSSGSAIADPVGSLFGALFAWVPGTAANLAVIAGIGILAYVGVRTFVDGLGQQN